jgi:hypothetical protein
MIDAYASLRFGYEADEHALITHQRYEYINEEERMCSAENALQVMEVQGMSAKNANSIKVKTRLRPRR